MAAAKGFSELIQEVSKSAAFNTAKVNKIFVNSNDFTYLWCDERKSLYSFASESPNRITFQTLIPSNAPVFEIVNVKLSASGRYALLGGYHGLGILELPRRWGDDGLYENGKSVIHCRLTLLDGSFFSHHRSSKICQASWYPGSPNDGHVVVLTNDNFIRFYDINSPDQPMMRLRLFDSPAQALHGSVHSFASVVGDVAVDFDIALPIAGERGRETYPVYVMQENGDVWVLYCTLLQNRIQINQHGPLTMHPPSDDNYGCEYSSILCLATVPTTVIMATCNGWIHHCIVLDTGVYDEDGEVAELRSVSSYADSLHCAPKLGLYVYESVQLEMALIQSEKGEDYDASVNKLPGVDDVKLSRDPLKVNGYISMSVSGIHVVSLPWIEDLAAFVSPETGASIGDGFPDLCSPAQVTYVLCTRPSESKSAISVPCGCVLIKDGDVSTLHCFLSSGEVASVVLRRDDGKSSLSETPLEGTVASGDGVFASPLRKLRSFGDFDGYIRQLLARSASVPVIKSGAGDSKISADEYYQILTKTTQILREEYIEKLVAAKHELEKRCTILEEKKREQMDEINGLFDESELRGNAEALASKLDAAQEGMRGLAERLSRVSRRVQSLSPILSDEENEWVRETTTMQENLVKLRRHAEVVKTKHENLLLRQPTENVEGSRSPRFSSSQIINIRAVLKEQGSSINDLMDNIRSLSLSIGS